MDYDLIISFLTIAFIFLALLFSIFLLSVKSTKKTSNVLLASFLLLIALDLSFFVYSTFITLHPSFEMLRIRLAIMKTPILFLFILSVIYDNFKFRSLHLLHTIPFLITILILLPRFFFTPKDQQIHFFEDYHNAPEIKLIQILGGIAYSGYMIACIFYTVKFKKIILANYTEGDSLLNYKWLKQLIGIVLIVSVLTLIKDYSKGLEDPQLLAQLRIAMLIGGLVFMTWLFLKGLHSPSIFRGIDSQLDLVNKSQEKLLQGEIKGPSHQPKETQIQEEEINKLEAYVLKNEPYLKPSLTIKELSKQTDIPIRTLSHILNHHYKKHFFDYINEHRVKKAMDMVQSDHKLSIKEIMYDVGFNSKNSFNTSFKKLTGLTPSQYKKSNSKV